MPETSSAPTTAPEALGAWANSRRPDAADSAGHRIGALRRAVVVDALLHQTQGDRPQHEPDEADGREPDDGVRVGGKAERQDVALQQAAVRLEAAVEQDGGDERAAEHAVDPGQAHTAPQDRRRLVPTPARVASV